MAVLLVDELGAGVTIPSTESRMIPSDKRLSLVKDIIVKNPDVAIRTRIPELMEIFWSPDFAYVRTQVEKQDGTHFTKYGKPIPVRQFQSEILQVLDAINNMVVENQDLMSFGYLNFAWGVVTEVLSSEHGLRIGTNNTYRRDESAVEVPSIGAFVLALKEKNASYVRLESHDLIEEDTSAIFPGGLDVILNVPQSIIILPHVSQTGLVKIETINDGLAFTMNGRDYALGFTGIGTNKYLSYDGLGGKNAVHLRYHDFLHVDGWLNKMKVDVSDVSISLRHMANFMNKIKSVRGQPSVEYALYDLFHENFASRHSIIEMIEYIKNPAVKRDAPGLGNNLHYGLEQGYIRDEMTLPSPYYNAVEDAAVLRGGIKFEGSNAFDTCKECFLPFYDEGIRLISEELSKDTP
jgi:hypothetical protein